MGATGESVRRLTDFGYHPSWSPDGRRIVFSTDNIDNPAVRTTGASGWIVDVETTETTRHANDGELRCIDWKTGRVMWSEQTLSRSSLMYVDGHFVCLGEDGMLRLIKADSKKYSEKTKTRLLRNGQPLLRSPAWAAPILARGLLYLRGKDRLVCAELIRAPQ